MKVAISIPSGDTWMTGFGYDLAHLCAATGASLIRDGVLEDLCINNVQGTILPSSRLDLVKLAIKQDCTHMLWLDSDMRFPADTLVRLLEHDKQMVAANYVCRRIPPKPITFKDMDWDAPDGEARVKKALLTTADATGLEKVDAIGFGVCLMHMSVIAAIKPPGFTITYGEHTAGFTGEDVSFCRAVKLAGIDIFIDHDLSKRIRHIGIFEYGHEHVFEDDSHEKAEQKSIITPED